MTAHAVLTAPLELGLCVTDLVEARRFYETTLGFCFVSQIETPEASAVASGFCHSGYSVVRLQLPTGERLKLFAPERPAEAAQTRGARPLSTVGFAYLTLIVSDIQRLMDALRAAGFPSRAERPFELRAGVHVVLIDDPDGNVVELVEYDDVSTYRPDVAVG